MHRNSTFLLFSLQNSIVNYSRCGYLVSPQGATLAVKADVHKVLVPDDCLEVAGHGVPVVVPRQPEQLAHPAPLLTQQQRAISISEKYKIHINAGCHNLLMLFNFQLCL